MNLTIKHNGQEIINTDHVIKQSNGLLAYDSTNIVRVIFNYPKNENNHNAHLLIDCKAMEGGENMDSKDMDKYGVIENENVLMDEEKEEIESELMNGNDSEHI